MIEGIKEKFKESLMSVLPIMIIMIIVSLLLKFSIVTICSILISTLLLILGITFFTYGADISMMEIGRMIGSKLVKSRKPIIICVVSFIVGIVITIAEPDLKVLADQMTAIDSFTFIMCVGVGVGFFLSLAAVRILYQIDLKVFIIIFYTLVLGLLIFVSSDIIPVAFDSGGVTTGPMSVPFIIAMGLGISASRSRKESKDNSFGLIALCSIGPILAVLIFGLIFKSEMSYTYAIDAEVTSFATMFSNYAHRILPTIEEVSLSLLPILVVFIIFNLITKKAKGKKLMRILIGIIITFLGLALFFVGVNVGYMPIAYLIGINTFKNFEILLIPLGIIVGYVIVTAEPAVAILTSQIEKITQGSISKKAMNNTIAIGVAIAVAISMIRVITGVSISYFLVIGYILAIILMFVSPKIFTMIAFDSGGAVSGPMTTSFLLPLVIGVCYQKGGNVLTDAFGVVALVAMSPLITIQLLGIAYNAKAKRKINIASIDETIVEYNWKCCHE